MARIKEVKKSAKPKQSSRGLEIKETSRKIREDSESSKSLSSEAGKT